MQVESLRQNIRLWKKIEIFLTQRISGPWGRFQVLLTLVLLGRCMWVSQWTTLSQRGELPVASELRNAMCWSPPLPTLTVDLKETSPSLDGSGGGERAAVILLAFSLEVPLSIPLFLFPLLERWCFSKDRRETAGSWSCVALVLILSALPLNRAEQLNKTNHPLKPDLRPACRVPLSHAEKK